MDRHDAERLQRELERELEAMSPAFLGRRDSKAVAGEIRGRKR